MKTWPVVLVLLVLSWSCHAQPAQLPLELRKSIEQLPHDIQALAVINEQFKFRIPSTDANQDKGLQFDQMLRWWIVSGGQTLEKVPDALKLLSGREVVWTFYAKRNQQKNLVPGKQYIELGVHPYEFVTVVRLAQELPQDFFSALNQSGRLYENTHSKSAWRLSKTNQYVVQMNSYQVAFIQTLDHDSHMLDDFLMAIHRSAASEFLKIADPILQKMPSEQKIWGVKRTKNSKLLALQDPDGIWESAAFVDDYKTLKISALISPNLPVEDIKKGSGAYKELKDLGIRSRIDLFSKHFENSIQCLPNFPPEVCFGLPILLGLLDVMIWI